uniref:Uncharacterized protein n=1 Tax=Chromera velia CCMP2878 TaxID=1169474 RepID=A0A0G4I4A7_9ALVE|eukprot:Cvel_10879.t1-p1 / transcript=Cvel_10879.t1 / gene=Cvel_10879 / organism=Chromera_velia_CCMP2878 / gene_product=hypothetical protein / transcript_product=hypothetical protein / location=Cvel_scaffold667:11918-12133(+) / protein_length=72 / sequence_SO=supercontig / SO=protein_coding / is_pseudo=false
MRSSIRKFSAPLPLLIKQTEEVDLQHRPASLVGEALERAVGGRQTMQWMRIPAKKVGEGANGVVYSVKVVYN